MKLSVQLVTWNGERYIKDLFESLRSQTFRDWQLFVLDNGSVDSTVDKIRRFSDTIGVSVNVIEKMENTGFAPAHNEIFESSTSEYNLVLNQDVILEPDVFARLVEAAENDRKLGSVSPRLMRLENGQRTDLVDSLGLSIDRKRKVTDRNAGERWGSEKVKEEVFGVSGTVALYRRSAVIASAGRLFDPMYFAYQEDVDIAWQLLLKGYTAKIVMDAVAYHTRSTRDSGGRGLVMDLRGKRAQSGIARVNSYKNHLATLYRNEQWQNFILDLPFIFCYELLKFVYFVAFDREVIKGLVPLFHERKILKKERKRAQNGAAISWRDFRHFIE